MKICAVNRIDYDGQTYNPGDEFECRKKAAERLIDLGVATLPQPKLEPKKEEGVQSNELLEQIDAAESTEALAALIPNQPDSQEIADAFAAKWADLEGKEQE